MIRGSLPSRLVLALASLMAACDDSAVAPEASTSPEDEYIVVLADSVRDPQAVVDALIEFTGAEVRFRYDGVVQGFAGRLSAEDVEWLRSDPRVDHVTVDGETVVRPVTQSLYRPSVGSQVIPWGVDSVNADVASTRAGDGSGAVTSVPVYILDTGVAAHPDLNVVRRVRFVGDVSTDCNGHGTHVAGIIAARDNRAGVVGVAPGAPLYSVKVLDCDGTGTESALVKGVNWVVKNAPRPAVVNLSLGTEGHSLAIHDAIVAAIRSGLTFVVAAGNADVNASTNEPAHIAQAITVGASDQGNCKAAFSNWGGLLDVFAPGTDIVSTGLGGGYAVMSGTSMAAPHVAGAAALLLATNPAASPAQVRQTLVGRARAVVTCGFRTSRQDSITTPRRLNVARF